MDGRWFANECDRFVTDRCSVSSNAQIMYAIDDFANQEQVNKLYEYYRTIFKEVQEDDICDFEMQYRGSDEESRDLLSLYTRFRGDMKKVFDWMICSRPDIDSHRFRDNIRIAIKNEDNKYDSINEFKAFTKWAEKIDKLPRPSRDPLRPSKKKKTSKGKEHGINNLALSILKNRQNRQDSLISQLEAKYGKPAKSGTKSKKKK